MESVGDGWRDELTKYFRSIDSLTEKSLKRIKSDRIRNNLPFDESFKKYFLNKTNLRIATAYTSFLYEECLEEEEVNQLNYGNAGASSQQQLMPTTIGLESIEYMPIILIRSSNEISVPNTSTTFVYDHPDDNDQMSEQIVISIPPNQSRLDSSKAKNNQNSDEIPRAQSTERIAMENEQRMESTIPDQQLAESKSSNDNGELNTSGSGTMIGSRSTGANRLKRCELVNKTVTSNTHQQAETIDLTSDQEDTADTLSSNRNNGQTQSNTRQQKPFEASAAAGSLKQMDRFNLFLHGGTHFQSNNCAAQPSEPTTPISTNQKSQELSSGNSAHRAVNNHEQRQNVDNESVGIRGYSSAQSTNTIDLMSDHTESVRQNKSGAAKAGNSVVRKFQSMTQQQTTKSNDSNGSVHLKKIPKLADAIEMEQQRLKCDFCYYSAEYQSDLTMHIRTHTGERPFECAICDRKFTREAHLNRHMKTHRNSFQFQCSTCRQGFSHEMKWKSHQDRCKAKGYECHLCKKFFLEKCNLVDHMRVHTGEKLRCLKFRKQFRSNCGLARHMKSHGNLFRFQCSNCRHGFSHKAQWKSHESRCKLKQFECFLCGKKCHQNKSSLLVHMRHKHTGEKRFGCSDCSKRFHQKSHLTRHTKRCHSKNK